MWRTTSRIVSRLRVESAEARARSHQTSKKPAKLVVSLRGSAVRITLRLTVPKHGFMVTVLEHEWKCDDMDSLHSRIKGIVYGVPRLTTDGSGGYRSGLPGKVLAHLPGSGGVHGVNPAGLAG